MTTARFQALNAPSPWRDDDPCGEPRPEDPEMLCEVRRDHAGDHSHLTGLLVRESWPRSDELSLDGYVDARGIRYVGKATRQPNGKYACLADVNGSLCRVEVTLTAVPVAVGARVQAEGVVGPGPAEPSPPDEVVLPADAPAPPPADWHVHAKHDDPRATGHAYVDAAVRWIAWLEQRLGLAVSPRPAPADADPSFSEFYAAETAAPRGPRDPPLARLHHLNGVHWAVLALRHHGYAAACDLLLAELRDSVRERRWPFGPSSPVREPTPVRDPAPARVCDSVECALYQRTVTDDECAVCGSRTSLK